MGLLYCRLICKMKEAIKKVTFERIRLVLSYVIRVTLLIAIISAMINRRWLVLFVSLLAMLLTFLPAIIERNYKVFLPAEFELCIIIFIYASLFLGEVHGYYTRFWWWDTILHTSSGLVLGFAGFLVLFTLYEEGKVRAKPITIVFFSFCFSVAIGAVWEIFEFSMDSIFLMNMQKSGLKDTMWDLIVDSGGAAIASILGYFYLKGGKTRLFKRLIERFIEKNPGIYRADDEENK